MRACKRLAQERVFSPEEFTRIQERDPALDASWINV
jgi:hypothetical protein